MVASFADTSQPFNLFLLYLKDFKSNARYIDKEFINIMTVEGLADRSLSQINNSIRSAVIEI